MSDSAGDQRAQPTDVTVLLNRAAGGDREGMHRLLDAVYDQLHRVAQQRMSDEKPGHTLQATALVHEAYLRLVKNQELEWSSRAHFYVAAAEAMRRILIEHARKKGRHKRGGNRQRVYLNVCDLAADENLDEVPALVDAIEQLEQEDSRAALVTRLRFYSGLTVTETAKALNLSERTVMREWSFARAWLYEALNIRDG